jgi:hypothetical protein
MEQTVSAWCKNILEADTQRAPTQSADGSLRTPGAVDFFRILNEEVGGGACDAEQECSFCVAVVHAPSVPCLWPAAPCGR